MQKLKKYLRLNSNKEAVINAINQFLIWYKTNNNAK